MSRLLLGGPSPDRDAGAGRSSLLGVVADLLGGRAARRRRAGAAGRPTAARAASAGSSSAAVRDRLVGLRRWSSAVAGSCTWIVVCAASPCSSSIRAGAVLSYLVATRLPIRWSASCFSRARSARCADGARLSGDDAAASNSIAASPGAPRCSRGGQARAARRAGRAHVPAAGRRSRPLRAARRGEPHQPAAAARRRAAASSTASACRWRDNDQNYRVVVVAEQTGDLEGTARAARASSLPLTDDRPRAILHDAERKRAFVPMTVRENLSWDAGGAASRSTRRTCRASRSRSGRAGDYPYGGAAARMCSAMSRAVSEKRSDRRPAARAARLPHRQERRREAVRRRRCAATAGNSQVEVNAVGRVIRELDARARASRARTCVLTLDMRPAALRAAAPGGRAERRRPWCSTCTTATCWRWRRRRAYDPDAVRRAALTSREWQRADRRPAAPADQQGDRRRICAGLDLQDDGGPGGARSGHRARHTASPAPAVYQLGNARFHCWKKGGHGTLDMVGGHQEFLRRLLLRARARGPASTRSPRWRAASASARTTGHRSAGREARRSFPTAPGSRRRSASPGSRAKRWSPASARASSGDAAAARRDGGAGRQWRPCGRAASAPRRHASATATDADGRRRAARRSIVSTGASRGRARGHERA